MFWKSNKRQAGFRIIKIYDGIKITDNLYSGPEEEILSKFNSIKNNPQKLAYKAKVEDFLLNIPNIDIEEFNPPKEENNIFLLGAIKITYKTVITKPKANPVYITMLFLLAWGIIGIIVTVFHLNNLAKQQRIDSQCYYYLKNGKPSTIEIQGRTYHFNSNGYIDEIDRTFLNPWDAEIINSGDCISINTK